MQAPLRPFSDAIARRYRRVGAASRPARPRLDPALDVRIEPADAVRRKAQALWEAPLALKAPKGGARQARDAEYLWVAKNVHDVFPGRVALGDIVCGCDTMRLGTIARSFFQIVFERNLVGDHVKEEKDFTKHFARIAKPVERLALLSGWKNPSAQDRVGQVGADEALPES